MNHDGCKQDNDQFSPLVRASIYCSRNSMQHNQSFKKYDEDQRIIYNN